MWPLHTKSQLYKPNSNLDFLIHLQATKFTNFLKVYKNSTPLTMASYKCFMVTFFLALAFSNINVALAARHLLQLPPLPSVTNLPKPTTLPPLQPTLPTLPTTQPSLPKPVLPALPSLPTMPTVPKVTLPPLTSMPTLPINIPTTMPSIPFLSPPPGN
ncbi:unnamed protein product [Dovyalis caffra]|uniref:Uncharacterized protein n=1 Tax=Dovyalis caffra TaxID=77055 RepID=A0AAV1QSN5_9ROSI|nr:unnamed protein product [Dovyalis caffra]